MLHCHVRHSSSNKRQKKGWTRSHWSQKYFILTKSIIHALFNAQKSITLLRSVWTAVRL